MKRIVIVYLCVLVLCFLGHTLRAVNVAGPGVPERAAPIETSTLTEMPCSFCGGQGGWYFGDGDKNEWRTCPIWECRCGKVPVEILHFLPHREQFVRTGCGCTDDCTGCDCGCQERIRGTISRRAVP